MEGLPAGPGSPGAVGQPLLSPGRGESLRVSRAWGCGLSARFGLLRRGVQRALGKGGAVPTVTPRCWRTRESPRPHSQKWDAVRGASRLWC